MSRVSLCCAMGYEAFTPLARVRTIAHARRLAPTGAMLPRPSCETRRRVWAAAAPCASRRASSAMAARSARSSSWRRSARELNVPFFCRRIPRKDKQKMEFRFDAPGQTFRCALQCVRCEGRRANGRCDRQVCIGTPLCWQHLRQIGLEIKESTQPFAGKGLFARRTGPGRYVFSRGSPIVRMHSEKITRRELDERYGDFTAPYGIEEDDDIEDGACLRGIGMLANHSARDANAEYRMHDGAFWVFAKENIAHGEEILVNYGNEYALHEQGVSHYTRRATETGERGGGGSGSASLALVRRAPSPRAPIPRAPTPRALRVGERVAVFWPSHNKEFKGTVERVSGKHTLVRYKDGSAWHKNLTVS